MSDYSGKSMEEIVGAAGGIVLGKWQNAAASWGSMAAGIENTQRNLDGAWNATLPFRDSRDSEARKGFEREIGKSRESATEWTRFAGEVGTRLSDTVKAIADTLPIVQDAARVYSDAANRLRDTGSLAHIITMANQRQRAADAMNRLAWRMVRTFDGVDTPDRPYQGPMTPKKGDTKAGGGDPDAPAGGAGAGTAAGAGAGAAGGAGDEGKKPAESPAAPKAPEAKDPLDQAGKFFDVVGKGIDLLGKPADVADKYVSLAQHLKDLLAKDGVSTEGLNLDELVKDVNYADLPTLAGGVGTAPSFDPGALTQAGTGGTAGSALPAFGSAAAGLGGAASAAAGAAPSLAGKAATSSAGVQQSLPPMYPPQMGGMGAAGTGGRGEVKPGLAASRSGFNVPAEQTETERWRRQGVQPELQGRTSGETRKRKGFERASKPTDQDVLDEELWRL